VAGGDPCSARNRSVWECHRPCSTRRLDHVRGRDGVPAVDGRIVDHILILARLGVASNRDFFKKGKNSAVRF
jgi:hypothetical protein